MSTESPKWRRLLQKYMPWLFHICKQGNYHWRWDHLCYCGIGMNGQEEPEKLPWQRQREVS